ncbi:MAG: hypothetical protein M3R49_02050 [Chloroflexota bacterium]|nr:hypothetical protein [Chloroflexota bacterium]
MRTALVVGLDNDLPELDEVFVAAYRTLLAMTGAAGLLMGVATTEPIQRVLLLPAALALVAAIAVGSRRSLGRRLAALGGWAGILIWAAALLVVGEDESWIVPLFLMVACVLGALHIAPHAARRAAAAQAEVPGASGAWIEEDGRIIPC